MLSAINDVLPRSDLQTYSPLFALIADYRREADCIERISNLVSDNQSVMTYFVAGSLKEQGFGKFTADLIFKKAPAIKALDAAYWDKAMKLSGVLMFMPADLRNHWAKQIREHEAPPFEYEAVKEKFSELFSMRSQFFIDMVDGIFFALSDDHVTNLPHGFGRRMIIRRMIDTWQCVDRETCNFIHDLRCVIGKFMGRDEPSQNDTFNDLVYLVQEKHYGKWVSFDGNSFRLKIHKNGTAHLEVHPEFVWRLNNILACKHPNALPESIRRPKKEVLAVDWCLIMDLIPFSILDELRRSSVAMGSWLISDTGTVFSAAAVDVLTKVGGTIQEGDRCYFKLEIGDMLASLYREGFIVSKP